MWLRLERYCPRANQDRHMVSNSTTTGQGEQEYTLIRISSHPCKIWLFRDPEGFASAIAKRFERKGKSVANPDIP